MTLQNTDDEATVLMMQELFLSPCAYIGIIYDQVDDLAIAKQDLDDKKKTLGECRVIIPSLADSAVICKLWSA